MAVLATASSPTGPISRESCVIIATFAGFYAEKRFCKDRSYPTPDLPEHSRRTSFVEVRVRLDRSPRIDLDIKMKLESLPRVRRREAEAFGLENSVIRVAG